MTGAITTAMITTTMNQLLETVTSIPPIEPQGLQQAGAGSSVRRSLTPQARRLRSWLA